MSITLSPQAQAQLEAVAALRGLPPEDALDRIIADARAASQGVADAPAVSIWKRAAALGAAIPAEERARAPHDGSMRYERYLYGTDAGE